MEKENKLLVEFVNHILNTNFSKDKLIKFINDYDLYDYISEFDWIDLSEGINDAICLYMYEINGIDVKHITDNVEDSVVWNKFQSMYKEIFNDE